MGTQGFVRSLVAPLVGFALFGALFAAVYYDDHAAADVVEREVTPEPPTFRMGPGAARAGLVWDSGRGENVTVDVRVVAGGPVDLYLVDVENLSAFVLNGTQHAFEPHVLRQQYPDSIVEANITQSYNATFFADGTTRWYLVYVSRTAAPQGYEELPAEEQEPYHTEVAVTVRYLEREAKSIVIGYLLTVPSLLLVALVVWMRWRKRDGPPPVRRALRYPADRDL